ncbi:MAG: sulfatase [Gemmatimonadetes bacterium]|nr:sulfatase [Gemmatimonadota bacterium]
MNIIYINPDELRADVLGCYGHPLVETPNIDRLAEEGTRFDQCHVQHTVCTPSRCSFMTGWYPHVSGHRTLWNPLGGHEPNTMRYLREAGYEVHWFGKNDCLAPEAFSSSVDRVHASTGPNGSSPPLFNEKDSGYYSFLRGAMDGPPRDEFIYKNAEDLIRNHNQDGPPLFMFLASAFPHPVYHAPQPWYDMYDPDDLPPLRPVRDDFSPDFHTLIRQYRRLDQLDEGVMRKIMAVYLGMTSYVDYLVGRLLKALDETGMIDNTAIFLFSDHGDWAGDYGLVEKWPSGLDDTLTRVPLIIRSPGKAKSHVVKEPVELFDIVPTTLELAGIDEKHTHFAKSQVNALTGASGKRDRIVFAEGGYDLHEGHCFEGRGVPGNSEGIYYPKGLQQQEEPMSVCRSQMARSSTHKLVRRSSGKHELYDLNKDPFELKNCFDRPEYLQEQRHLSEAMLDWQLATSDVTPLQPQPRGFPPGLPKP